MCLGCSTGDTAAFFCHTATCTRHTTSAMDRTLVGAGSTHGFYSKIMVLTLWYYHRSTLYIYVHLELLLYVCVPHYYTTCHPHSVSHCPSSVLCATPLKISTVGCTAHCPSRMLQLVCLHRVSCMCAVSHSACRVSRCDAPVAHRVVLCVAVCQVMLCVSCRVAFVFMSCRVELS
jgi:hypothetical protein